ncbi:MAG: redox-regulated ATPase YchF [Halobacteriales archaeon]
MDTLALAGKPNTGKSTFFAAATMADVETGNYPFTTIDPNRGVTHARTRCPCLDLDERCGNDRCHDGKRYVPVEFVDVAGLVPGAHEGRGLGNQFLDALTDADVIVNVIDAAGATDADGAPVPVGTHDPLEEVDFVVDELDHWLADIVERNWEGVQRRSRSPEFDLEEAMTEVLTGVGASSVDVAQVLRELEYPSDPLAWDRDQFEALGRAVRRRTKPVVVAANKVDDADEATVEALLELDVPVVPTTAEGELALRRAARAGLVRYDPGDATFDVVGEVSDAQRRGLDQLRETMAAWDGTGVQATLDAAVYEVLDRVTVYPVQDAGRWTDGQGNVLPDAILLERGSTPRDLAYAVHSDIGEGYLHAVDARTGRDLSDAHELQDGDVVKIVSTAR